ncbi:hypothetical protein EMCRGX_G029663 [Ephydatia muelleri]|eukprot:Em0013g100a
MFSAGLAVISLAVLHQAYALQPLKASWLKRDLQYASLNYQAQLKKGISFTDIKTQFPSIEHVRTTRQASSINSTTAVLNDFSTNGLIHYSGDYSQIIFVLLWRYNSDETIASTNLYRSANYGATFTNIESQLDSADRNPLLWPYFYTSTTNNNFLAFPHATRSQMYITRDEGLTFTKVTFSQTINPRSLQWYPGEDNWILGLNTQSDVLYVTQDTGTSWTLVDNYVDNITDFQWGDPTIDPAHIVYYNVYNPTDRSRGNYTVHLYTKQPPFTNAAQEFDPNLGRHDDFLLLGQYIFAQQTDSSGNPFLKVSYNRKPFQIARIPSTFGHVNYIVSHINNLQALVIVQHVQGQYNLYLSDSSGVYYSMSLPDLVQEGGTTFDLQMIEGVNGTMVANQYVRSDPSQTNSPIRTLITFNNGGRWRLIEPPDVDVNGNAVNCEPPSCSLHFFMDTSDYFRLGVYAQDSAPGLIVAHGSLGAQLSSDPDVYISRNGGITWSETLSNSWGLNYLDHGGLLVAARDYHQAPSTVLKYSVDEGLHWQDYTFSNVNAYVFGVITEPGETTTIVSLYGWTSAASGWIIWTVKFASVFSRVCTDNDYYTWSPWDERAGQACVLGYQVNIERRRSNVTCLNSRTYVRKSTFSVCICALEDYECDYGYMHDDGLSGPCVRDTAISLSDLCAGDALTYTKTSGYRKIAGDGCIKGLDSDLAPVIVPCCFSVKTGQQLRASVGVITTFFLITLLVVGGLIVAVVVLACKLRKARRAVYTVVHTSDTHQEDESSHHDLGTDDPSINDDDEPLKP